MQHWFCDETLADVYHPLLIHFSKTLTCFKLIVLIALLHTHTLKPYEFERTTTSYLIQQENCFSSKHFDFPKYIYIYGTFKALCTHSNAQNKPNFPCMVKYLAPFFDLLPECSLNTRACVLT